MKSAKKLEQLRDTLAVTADGDAFDLMHVQDHAAKQTGPYSHGLAKVLGSDKMDHLPDHVLEQLETVLASKDAFGAPGKSDGHRQDPNHDFDVLTPHAPSWKGGSSGGRGKGKNKDDGSSGGTTGDTGGTTGDTGGTTGDTGGSTGGTTGGSNAASDPAPQYAIDALMSGYKWGSGAVTIKYSFLDALPSYYSSTAPEANNFSSFTVAQEQAAKSVLDQISSVANVTFIETTDPYAQIAFGNASLGGGVGAWTYYPYSTSANNFAGDVWVNSDYAFNLNPTIGTFSYLVLIHELGHAMGLKHPFEGTATLSGAENTRQYTVEAYNADPWMPGVEPQSYMTYDIAALQYLYGANAATGAGDNVYAFDGANNLVQTIWDAGGLDSFDASGASTPVTLDLRAGHFSSVGTLNGTSLAKDNVAIAYGVTIENAVGGSGNDTIIGNAAANRIVGGGGDDLLTGGGGADVFVFANGFGQDIVTDFEDGLDLLDFRAFGATLADATIANGATGAVVDWSGATVTLTGIWSTQLDTNDFLFA